MPAYIKGGTCFCLPPYNEFEDETNRDMNNSTLGKDCEISAYPFETIS
jgi:hypothetical protein